MVSSNEKKKCALFFYYRKEDPEYVVLTEWVHCNGANVQCIDCVFNVLSKYVPNG